MVKVSSIPITLNDPEQIENVLEKIAEMYKDPYRVIYEYIQNSVDSAHQLRESNKGDFPYRININIDYNAAEKSITISDNAEGMSKEIILDLAKSILKSRKKALPWAIGCFGYGVQAFRGYFKSVEFMTRPKRNKFIYFLKFQKKNTNDNEFREYLDTEIKFPYKTGTIVILKDFISPKYKFEHRDINKLINNIELHFENILREQNIEISISESGARKYICKPLDYDKIEGTSIIEEISLDSKGVNKIFINLKVTKTPDFDRRPRFTCKNIRINEICATNSFQRFKNSDLSIWEHPNLIGYIEVGNFVHPQLERSDFKNEENRDILYAQMDKLEIKIKKHISEIEQQTNKDKLEGISRLLEDEISKLMKEDALLYKSTHTLTSGNGNFSDGGGDNTGGFGGPNGGNSKEKGRDHGTGGGSGDGPDNTGAGSGDGVGTGGINSDDAGELNAIKKKTPGIKIVLKEFGADDDTMSMYHDGIISINTNCKEYKERNISKNQQNATVMRFVSYLSQIVAMYYIQKKNEKYNENPIVGDKLYFDFIKIVCKLESRLFKHKSFIIDSILNKN